MEQILSLEDVKNSIRNIPDYPKKGIQFKDLTTALKQQDIFAYILDELTTMYSGREITKVVGIESRGFIMGGALAASIGAGFVPLRKSGKLPSEKYTVNYTLEYGEDSIEIHKDAIEPGEVVLLHDDLLATGGTSLAALKLLSHFKPEEIYLNYIVELDFLDGRGAIGDDFDISSLIHYNSAIL